MASIKVKFRPSSVRGQEGRICYQVIHNRTPRQIPTAYMLFPDEWDTCGNDVAACPYSARRNHIRSVREHIRMDVTRLAGIIRRLDDRGISYTADDVCRGFHEYLGQLSFAGFAENLIQKLRQNGKLTTAGHYRSMLNSVRRFISSRDEDMDDLLLDTIDCRWAIDYEAWLLDTGVARNTSSFYIRILRSVYNNAVECGIIGNANPFRRVYTGVDKTVKRALPTEIIAKIKRLDLNGDAGLDYARDMFMLAFYLRGMSFVDMSYLKKTDLKHGVVVYRRRKTGQTLAVRWKSEMQAILDKYGENESDYLLPIIRRRGLNERCAYRNAADKVNRNLKKLAGMVGAEIKLTHYVARHSWASAARSKNVPLSVISEGMGHDSETTTLIYLASLDTSAVDRANDAIIGSL